KIETELWNLEVQGTDLTRYNQRFQELSLLCVRTCPEESNRVERYIGGLPDSIHGSVTASKPCGPALYAIYQTYEITNIIVDVFKVMFFLRSIGTRCWDTLSNTPPDSYSAASNFRVLQIGIKSQDTIMSDSEDSTVTYTTVSSPCEGRSGGVSPGEDRPPVIPEDHTHICCLTNADSPGYIPESDPDEDPEDDDEEDPEEDPVVYPADHDDDDEEEEPSGDDADEEDEEQDEDNDDKEEEHPASADSILPPPTLFFTKEDAERFLAMPIPPPLPLTPLLSSLPQIPAPPLPPSPLILPIPLPVASIPLHLLSSDRRTDRPEVTLPPQKRLNIVHGLGYEAGESSVAAAARPMEGRRADYGFVNSVEAEIRRRREEDIGYGIRDTWIDPSDVAEEEALTTLEGVN
nr:reverse transcriptase domain-containing protein [Tanacetum cinerariifolium]